MATRTTTAVRKALEPGATAAAILDAAGDLLVRYGEDGLSIRELCARVGVTPPTIYHHFGDKQTLVDRVVDDCFAEFDRAFDDPGHPADPVAALGWMFERYVAYGATHPAHYRLIFQRAHVRPTPAGLASFERLRRTVARIAAAGRLRTGVDDASAACWAAAHGVTALVVAGFLPADTVAATLVGDAIKNHITTPLPSATRRRASRRPNSRRSR